MTTLLCRICKGSNLEDVIDLGEQNNTSKFPMYKRFDQYEKSKVVLCICKECELLQLRYSESQDSLYRNECGYGYESGISNTMRNHLRSYNKEIQSKVCVTAGDVVLDIGSNDCTMLSFYPEGVVRVGVDPTGHQFEQNYQHLGARLVADYFSKEKLIDLQGKCKVVSSISMFYDLPDPVQFAKDVYDMLSVDGIWTCEQSYLPTMLRKKSFDTICHEHLEYYGLSQVKRIADEAQLKIIDVLFNDANGGSFRVYFVRNDSTLRSQETELIESILRQEADMRLGEAQTYIDFMAHCDEQMKKLRYFLQIVKDTGLETYVYGASTKGNCLLQYAGIDEELCGLAVERNMKKVGKMTCTGIRITSEAEMRRRPPAFLLVLPWHFKEEIIEREKEFLDNGGQFIFPLPNMEVVGTRKKLLITGCDGMIGGYVQRHMHNEGRYNMYGIGRSKGLYSCIEPSLPLLKGCLDMNDTTSLEYFLSCVKPDVIVHLAGISSSKRALEHEKQTIYTNGLATVNLCDIIHRRGWKDLILFNASSSEIFKGDGEVMLSDELGFEFPNFNLTNPYAIAKTLGHSTIEYYRRMYGYNWSNGILFTTESKHKCGDFLLKKLSTHIQSRRLIETGPLDSYRNMIHASDVARAIYTIVEQPFGDTYIVSNISNELYMMRDIVKQMYMLAGYTIEDRKTDKSLVDAQTGEVLLRESGQGTDMYPTKVNGNPCKLLQLGWKPMYALSHILREYVEE